MTGTIVAIRNGAKVERVAPCGAPLATARKRPLSGAPLYRRIERQLRDDQLSGWGLPLDLYDCEIERDDPAGSVMCGMFIRRSMESLTATFTHRETGARVVVSCIWADDDGQIIQWGSEYGDLVL